MNRSALPFVRGVYGFVVRCRMRSQTHWLAKSFDRQV